MLAERVRHTGGRFGKGGDLLYRWGNPQAYGAGTAADQRLFAQFEYVDSGRGIEAIYAAGTVFVQPVGSRVNLRSGKTREQQERSQKAERTHSPIL